MNNSIKKGVVVAVILLFVTVSVIPSTGMVVEQSSITTFNNGDIFYVGGSGPGNYTKIQDAINDAFDGDTVFVYNGTYFENIIIDKSLSLIGEERDSTIIDGGETEATVMISSNNVCIRRFWIQESEYYPHYYDGIKLRHADNANISDNLITGSYSGIYNYCSNGTTIYNNTILYNIFEGIDILYSSDIAIKKNVISETFQNEINGQGIFLIGVNNTIISHNSLKNNINGIVTASSFYTNIFQNIIDNNSRYGIIFWPHNLTSNNTITNNLFINNKIGILFNNCSNNSINFNNFIGNKRQATFKNCRNVWNKNYWNRPRILPKPIFGIMIIGFIPIPWLNFDWRPAQEPYDIGV